MKATVVDNWTITPEPGYGKPPLCRKMMFFCIVPPRVKTETRVDRDGLELVLPSKIYKKFMEGQEINHDRIKGGHDNADSPSPWRC